MKKIMTLVLTLALAMTILAGCGKNKPGATNAPTVTPTEAPSKPVTACVGSEPKSIDPTLNNAVDGAIYINHAFEGLTKTNKDNQTVPGMAESWTVSTDGTVYTFKLRDAKWSDGKAVKAADFVYSWRRAVDPNTAAEYAYQMYYIKNAQAINTKKDFTAADLQTLGVKAIDDKTLEVTLEAQCGYFTTLCNFPTYYPLREDIVAGNDKWTNAPETYVTNGAYVMKTWSHGDKLVFVKSDNYYAKSEVLTKEIDFLLMEDQTAMLTSFKNGDLLFSDDLPSQEIPAMQATGDLKIEAQLGTYFYVFNTTKAPFDNAKVRKALTLAIDRRYLVDKVSQGNQIPAGAFVPFNVPDVAAGSDFRKNGKDYYNPETAAVAENITKAKALLAEAGYTDMTKFPKLELKYNTSAGHKAIAEYIAAEWSKNLGITVKLQNEEWAVFQDSRTKGNYEVARHGWLGDYVDPMTFLDMWTTTSGQNDAKWSNTNYDTLIDKAKKSTSAEERMKAMHDAEDILMSEMPVMPIYYYTDVELISKNLKGMVYTSLGFKYFTWCTVS